MPLVKLVDEQGVQLMDKLDALLGCRDALLHGIGIVMGGRIA